MGATGPAGPVGPTGLSAGTSLGLFDANGVYVGPVVTQCSPQNSYGYCHAGVLIRDATLGLYTIDLWGYPSYYGGPGENLYGVIAQSNSLQPNTTGNRIAYTDFSIFWSNQNCTGTPYADVPGVGSSLGINMALVPMSVPNAYGTIFVIKPNQTGLGYTPYQSVSYGGSGCSNIGVALITNGYLLTQIQYPFTPPLHFDLH
jgi:hypothetical protein